MSENAFVSEMGGTLTPNHTVEPAELVGDQIDSALEQFGDRARKLIEAAEKRTITDNDEIGKAADLRSMIDALLEAVWNRAKEIAEPHTLATNVVKGRTQRFITPLETASETLRVRIGECRTMQRDRARKQAEEQRAAEQALRAAAGVQTPQEDEMPAPAPIALPSIKGDYGSSVSDRATTSYSYEDVRALPDEVLNAPAVKKAIQSAIRAYARLNPNVPGVTSSAGVETSHRRPN